MLRRLGADYSSFKTLEFHDGLNILVADTAPQSAATDSRNGAGKSSVIELIHFLLGSRPDRSIAARRELRNVEFELLLDWPSLSEPLSVRRKAADAGTFVLTPDVSAKDTGRLDLGAGRVSMAEWNALIGSELFGIRPDRVGISARLLLSYYIRRISSNGFNEAIRAHSRQAEVEATTNLAYLLGLDWELSNKYREISAREATRKQLRKAVDDPAWGRIVGNAADLRGQITLAEARVAKLEEQINEFNVVPEYERLQARADEIGRQIRQLSNADEIDQRNLKDLEDSISETADTEVHYLEPVYSELGVLLSDQVRQRFEDVKAFHESVVRNRRRYLNEEIEATRARLETRKNERESLGAEQAQILRQLGEGGALEALNILQRGYAEAQASLEALTNRMSAAQALESSARQIAATRLEIEEQMAADLEDRQAQIREATLLFDEFAKRLYGDERSGYLAIDAGRNSLKIAPRIDSDESRGIGNMVIFCFDLTIAVVAHRHGRGPDFIVHDSHLFDGVDDRQLTAALELARDACENEAIQYIATINSDDLNKALARGFEIGADALPVRLMDRYDDGGLFGFRF